ncbi:MAG: MarR family transcriptional regulator [Verrucomicrobiota bacterium]
MNDFKTTPLADLTQIPHWIGVSAMITLFHLRDESHCSSELSDLVGVSPASMTGTIDHLLRKGLVTRQRNPEDRRKIIIRSTESGQELISRVFQEEPEETVPFEWNRIAHRQTSPLPELSRY